MSITLATIARACGVSPSTVSLALRNHPRIPEATKARIKSMAAELGYTPNPSVSRVMSEIRAGGKKSVFKESLAYFTADAPPHPHSYETRLFAGVVARAEAMGYKIDRFELGKNGLTLTQLGKVLASRGIRGLILAPWPQAHSEHEIDWKNLASVAIGYSLEAPNIHRVSRDIMHTLRGVFTKLSALGYQRIGFVMERSHEARMEFMTLAAYQLHNFLSQEEHRLSPLVAENLTEEIFTHWTTAQKPDVIFTMYRPIVDWLRNANYRVPEDIGVFAFNCESPESEFSGIYPAYESLGAAAVEQVSALIERSEFGLPHNPGTLIVPGIPCPGNTLRF
ncbi:LacI family DNA-binding transcriptional regulator [Kiritimatiellaeota bacterium B1221]|nr:LacI family DNA-binding transcriptional regulator [Kiritimatiellaeota bacterium B1221]